MRTKYDTWKTSPPEDPDWAKIPLSCDCWWEGTIEDADHDGQVCRCPECWENLGSIDDNIKWASEGWD